MSRDSRSNGILLPPCPKCRIGLPVRPAWLREVPRNWFCANSGTAVLGMLICDAPTEFLRRIHGQAVEIGLSGKRQPSPNMVEFLRERNRQKERTIEKRAAPRHATTTQCPVVPIDDQFRVSGAPLIALVRNLSMSGISLVHSQRVQGSFLALELTLASRNSVQLAMRIRRCRPFGPYFEIGGEFVMRLNRIADPFVAPSISIDLDSTVAGDPVL